MLVVMDKLGFADARMEMKQWTTGQVGLILLGAGIAASVNVGSLAVISIRSPLFWSSVQMLAIPISVVFDFAIRGIKPNWGSGVGYIIIIVACFMLNGILSPKCAAKSGSDSQRNLQ